MSTITKPVILNETGIAIRDAILSLGKGCASRINSLDGTVLACDSVVEAVGIPQYVEDVTPYAAYGLTESGWYVFAKIAAEGDIVVTADTTVEGAAGVLATLGANYVCVAVKFDVAAISKKITVNWGSKTETFVFKATDLATRNLDYRTTFYVYDIAPYTRWEFARTTDLTAAADRNYYTKNGDNYTKATLEAGANVAQYYTHSYALTQDETFAANKAYYTRDGDTYTAATVTAGEAVTADTYYEDVYTLVEGGTFADGTAYYTFNGTDYAAAEVTAGTTVPAAYYVHSKVIFEGMARNITYQCSETIDCPQVYVLPEIEDDTHGCWVEIRLRHSGAFSSTLEVPEGVKVATEHTQAETAGLNTVDLHYNSVNGVKLWRFLNTHSTIPA